MLFFNSFCKQIKILAIIIASCFTTFSCVKTSENKIAIETQTPDQKTFKIYNESNYTSEFNMKINGLDFTKDINIINYIKCLASEYPDEPRELNALRFIQQFTWHDYDITISNLSNSPSTMISSLGGGLCGTRASVLTNILIKMGYMARCWELDGHVVTEVYSNNKWKVLDPDMGAYYLNNIGEIASYEELCLNPELLYDANNIVYCYFTGKGKEAMIKKLYYLFKSTSNNSQHDTNPKNNTSSKDNQFFCLPPHSTMVFPLNNLKNKTLHTTCQLFIPYYCGKVISPLIPINISGSGIILLNGIKHDISSYNMQEHIINNPNYDFCITILENKGGVTIDYLINPLVYGVQEKNNICFSGKNVNRIKVELIHDENTSFLNPIYNTWFYEILFRWISESNQKYFETIRSDEDFFYILNEILYKSNKCDTCKFINKFWYIENIKTDTAFINSSIDSNILYNYIQQSIYQLILMNDNKNKAIKQSAQ